MTEKEKMLAGESYDTRDPELIEMYHNARKLMQVYNALDSTDTEGKKQTLSDLLGHIGDGAWIESPFFCDYGVHISVGENTVINTNCMFIDDNTITIGKNGLIAPFVQIYTAKHPVKASDRIQKSGNAPFTTLTSPVHIGDNVWIGGNSVILPGVTIGDNVTIGAGSVVTKDIPDNTLAFGNPCAIIKTI
ncbi:sugar O-acetyltransferase [Aquimarina megaterium]|uniref:sugar O-acetyltransferase n=1 Tax=Aquimarina megaterium TaxID=1443666 RepID=UPI000942CF84|nr:sugar O-acetyltransferase [Aquimarina megaterium]